MQRAFIAVSTVLAIVSAWLLFGPNDEYPRETGPVETLKVSNPASRTYPNPDGDGSSPESSGRVANAGTSGQVKATTPVTAATTPPRTIPVTVEFVSSLVTGPDAISFALPDGRAANGTVDQRHLSADGAPAGVSGRLSTPGKGNFIFRIQPPGSPVGPVVGAVAIDGEDSAFRVMSGPGNIPLLTELPADQVICRNYTLPPENADEPEEIPAEHPTNIPIPPYQNGIIPLQSRPGAPGVIYLDFDGQTGPQENWGNFDAAPASATNTQIKDVWARVSEDYSPFNLNITTDLQVYLNASEISRQRCIITPTTTAAPGAGGVAWVGSFAWSGDIPCWSFYATGKNATEVISHEIGHTLGLSHDGRFSPSEGYYLGHGTDPVGWAPIMGAGYYKNLSQWSKGEYLSANQFQDDVAIIAANYNVGKRTDDAGDTQATSALLEIFAGGVVNSQGTIESQSDVDAFRFTTSGGSVSLAISTVSVGPDLDILASLYDASGTLILSNNPDTSLNASLSTTLGAGDYTVRVDGVGRGSALVDGYTDYASLGQYTITGAITGALVPDRFTIAENPTTGASVGTPNPRNNHGSNPLTYSIAAGNTGSAFVINSITGTITVATPSVINYETLSTSWTNPPAFNLTVNVTDTVNPALNESLRVVIAISNVNEPPVINGASTAVVISHTVDGTPLATVTASDPDNFDFPVYSIASGNTGGKFSISQTGLISVAGDLDAATQSSWPLVIRASDHGSPVLSSDLTVTVTVIPADASYTPGIVYHTIYENIGGSNVSSLTGNSAYPAKPTREVPLADFTDNTQGDGYGSAIRAWMIAPYTGRYQFWVSGDDTVDLYFSATGSPASKAKICYRSTSSNYQQWFNSGTSQSSTYNLIAGQICYIEALHKENSGGDHVSVAWEIRNTPGSSTILPRSVIPGRYLSPHRLNYQPVVPARTADLYRNTYAGHSVATASATDLNAGDTHTWAITSGNSEGIFSIDAATGQIQVENSAALASYPSSSIPLTLTATDNGSAPLSGSGTMTVNLLATGSAPTAGLIQEFWDYVVGTELSSLYSLPRYPNRPDHLADLTSFDSGSAISDNYGARIRAYLIPPATGSYTFYLASDNNGSLLLSPDSNPANAVQIASVATYCSYQSWNVYPSQTSSPVTLTAGQRYFIEGRVKEGTGGDHLSVAWTGPSISTISVIGDANTEPYDSNVAPEFGAPSYAFNLTLGFADGTMAGTVAASDSPFEDIRYAIVSGNTGGAFQIDPVSGVISVANSPSIGSLATYNLQVGAQDSGHGRHFAPRETLVPVVITAPDTNVPPVFTANPVNLGPFPAGQLLVADISPFVSDPGDTLSFALVSGPSWIGVSGSGTLSGNPGYQDFGSYQIVVSADDGHGQVVQGNVTFTVSAPPAVPATTLTAADATPLPVTGTVVAGNAGSASAGDGLYLELRESESTGTSALEHLWTLATPPGRSASLNVEAFHTANTEGDDFRISVSTDGGSNFSDAILVTKTSDDDIPQSYSFITGSSTIIRVTDADRTPGNSQLDSFMLDLLSLDLSGNEPPSLADATLQVASHAPVGVSLGTVVATDPDPGQTLSFSIPRGNEAGFFSVSPSGDIRVASDIAPGSGPFVLTVVAADNGPPSLAGYATVTVNVISPVAGGILIESLTSTFDGTPQPVQVTTDPPGLAVLVTYDGSSSPPVHAGSYAILATIRDAVHAGNASASQMIAKAQASIGLEDLAHTYDGTPKPATATTSPTGLAVNLTYDGLATPPANAGTFAISASIDDPDYSGTASGSLEIGKAAASVSIGSLAQLFDGYPKPVSATTDPPGLAVEFSYDGSADAPSDAGTYPVTATIVSSNFSGGTTTSLVISPAIATIFLTDLSQTYDGMPRPVSYETTPPGIPVEILYDGIETAPTDAGSYAVSASVIGPNYSGASFATLEIAKATATVTLGNTFREYDGSPKSITAITSPEGLATDITYDGSVTPPSTLGTYAVVANVNDSNHAGSASGTLVISNSLIIGEGQTFVPLDNTSIYQLLMNDGTLAFGSGTLHIATDATNHGILRLTGDAILQVSGTFTNTGIIDIINWTGTLPPDIINTGTIIDRSSVRVLSVENDGSHLNFSIPGFDGHRYQLEETHALDGPWTPLGDPVSGSGSLADPPALEFSPQTGGPGKFFRVRVTPAP